MPGHVKLGKAGEPDPDPVPYLVVTMEMKRADMLRAYDSKKSYWCPDDKGGYCECMLETDDGTKAVVMCGHIVSTTQKYLAFQVILPFPQKVIIIQS
jgi:hypothetical protein